MCVVLQKCLRNSRAPRLTSIFFAINKYRSSKYVCFLITHRRILFRLQRRSVLPRHLPWLRSRLVSVRRHVRGWQHRRGHRRSYVRQYREEVWAQVQSGSAGHQPGTNVVHDITSKTTVLQKKKLNIASIFVKRRGCVEIRNVCTVCKSLDGRDENHVSSHP